MYFQDFFKKTLRWYEAHMVDGVINTITDFTQILDGVITIQVYVIDYYIGVFLYIMNSKLGFDFNILCQYKICSELDLLDLPYTYGDYSDIKNENDLFWNWDYENLKFKTVFDVKNQSVKLR